VQQQRAPALIFSVSPARPYRAATGAELAAVLLDQRGVAAFLADFAGQCFGSGGFAFFLRDIHHAHVLYRKAVLIQDAEHRVTVDDQFGDIGNRRGVAFHLDAAGHARHEIAERFAEVEQLAQLHADPGRVDDAHVQAQYLA
jgi:hypothetical protein